MKPLWEGLYQKESRPSNHERLATRPKTSAIVMPLRRSFSMVAHVRRSVSASLKTRVSARSIVSISVLEPKKLLINSSEAVSTGIHVLRQAQHERIILNISESPSVHPELVEGRTEGFSTASYITPVLNWQNHWVFEQSRIVPNVLSPCKSSKGNFHLKTEINVRVRRSSNIKKFSYDVH